MNHFITFGDDTFKYKKLILERDAKLTGWFDNIIIHSPETISDFLSQHKDFIESSNRGYGYWVWKPYVIFDTLHKINDGDFVFYVDSGATILQHKQDRFYEYIDILNNSDKPVMVFHDTRENSQYQEKYLQKMRLLKEFGLENNQAFLNSGQVESGVVICKKCDFSISFIEEWYKFLIKDNYSLVTDVTDSDTDIQLDDFICHRHDQAILSILSKSYKVNLLDSMECYGNGPFFSTRTTDHGPKEKAPDGCRGEIDFDPTKNFGWKTYLSDADVIQRTLNEIKNIFSRSREELKFCNIDYNLKKEFVNLVMEKIDNIQSNKGLFKIQLNIYEPGGIALNKERLSGSFYCEFNIGDKYSFNFVMTDSDITFPENKLIYDRMFENIYTRTWSS